ncbi:MAG: CatB-related O-acetyltransferase [Jatrophihabitans sp.]|uniref:CatB-related O-acetyltransferase n=1 Tax=Jatrophihabitans sp. TaxID=1932789 RepID=UPI0039122501
MTDGGVGERIIAARLRARDALQRQVRQWVFGVEANFPGDPRRRLIADETVSPEMRLVQYSDSDGSAVRIGSYTALAPTAIIFHGGLHRSDWVSAVHVHFDGNRWVWPEGALHDDGPVVIGSDVLVTFEALIMSGVTIGDGAIIAPRAVVTRDVEPYEIVGGNPAKHIKWRFDEDTRAALLRIRWWDWPREKVLAHRAEIDSPDVQGFIERHDPARRDA